MRPGAMLTAGRGFAVVGAMLLGASAVLLFEWSSQDGWRVLIILALFGLATAINGQRTNDENSPVTGALGAPIRTGIGVSSTFLGAYLAAPLLLKWGSTSGQPPSTTVIVLLLYGLPLLALLWFAIRGVAAGTIGAALVAPLLIPLLMATAGASTSTIAVVSLGIAVAALITVVMLDPAEPLAEAMVVFGGMAASSAVGAGTAAAGSLATQIPDNGPSGAPPAAPQVVVLALGLLVAVGLVFVAVSRRQLTGGLVAGSVLAVPPTALLVVSGVRHTADDVVLLAIPALAVIIAVVVLVTRQPVHVARAAQAAIGVALVVGAQAMIQFDIEFDWHQPISVIDALLITGAVVLAWFVADGAGTLLAAAVLVGLALNQPWWNIAYAWGYAGTPGRNGVVAGIGLAVTLAVAALLVRRHRAPAVVAAAAYALAGPIAAMVAALLHHPSDVAIVGWLIGPVVLLGIPAAVAALRGHGTTIAAAQAAGTVLLTVGGFTLILMVLGGQRTLQSSLYAGIAELVPTLPSGVIAGPALPTANGLWVAALAMFVIAVPLLLSTVRRPSAPLAAAGLAVVVESALTGLFGLADTSESSVAELIVIVSLVAGAMGLVAVALLRRGYRAPELSGD